MDRGLYQPLLQCKPVDDRVAAMAGQIETLKQEVSTLKNQGGGSDRKCHNCGSPDHLAKDCTKETTQKVRRTAPKDGEPTTRTRNDKKETWCQKCRFWNSGSKEHTTEQHKTRREREAEPAPPAPPAPPATPGLLGGMVPGTNDEHQPLNFSGGPTICRL